jgi:hypothetical protein
MVGCPVNEEFEIVSGETEQNHEIPVRTAGVTAEIRTENLTHTIRKLYRYINPLGQQYLKLNSVAVVRKRTIPTERRPLVGEVSANLCG